MSAELSTDQGVFRADTGQEPLTMALTWGDAGEGWWSEAA
jgi:hypothetical protein